MRQLALIVLWTQLAVCGFERTETCARAAALGGAYIGLANDVWSVAYNVGGLAFVHRNEVSVFHSPAAYGLSELSRSGVSFAVPFSGSTVAVSLRRYGFDLYKEFTGMISFATVLSEIAVGMSISYNNVAIHSYGSASAFGINVGLLLPIHSQLTLGLSAVNLNAPTIGVAREPLPQSFSFGVAYRPYEQTVLLLDYVKDLSYEGSVKSGLEYWIADAVAIRGGVTTEPTTYNTGVGILYSFFEFDYAFSMNEDLGATHEVSLLIHWGGGNK